MARKSESKKELAYLLYMQNISNVEIMERVGIGSNKTISSWIQAGGWKEKRAAKTISRTELINKTLGKINELLESESFEADKLSKLAALVQNLDRQNSPIVVMDVFMDFGRWLQALSQTNREVTVDLIKKVNHYQDLYITQKLNT